MIKMIDNYKKLSIKKYYELQDIDLKDREEIDIQVEILSILSDMTEDEIMDLPLPEYQKLVKASSFLSTSPTPTKNIPQYIIINGTKYRVLSDIKEFKAGQYIDYNNYLKMDKNIPYVLSTLLIPYNKTYGDYDIMKTIEDISNHLSIIDAISLSAFFLKKWESLTKALLTYLTWKMKRMMRKTKNKREKVMIRKAMREMIILHNTIKNGDGSIMP